MNLHEIPTEIIEAYIFANTPAYLLKKLQNSSYVHSLSKLGNDELLSLITDVKDNNINSTALAYASLVALLLKKNSIDLSKYENKTKLNWFRPIINLFLQKNRTINDIKISLPKTLNLMNSEHYYTINYQKVESKK